MVWILSVVTALILIVFDNVLISIGRFIGATNLSSTLFLMGILFILAILLNLTTKMSALSIQLRLVNQELGLLRCKVDQQGDAQSKEVDPETGS
jgi:hypothetical protein